MVGISSQCGVSPAGIGFLSFFLFGFSPLNELLSRKLVHSSSVLILLKEPSKKKAL